MAKRTESDQDYNKRRLVRLFSAGPDDECWPWQGALTREGYGVANVRREGRRTTSPAHRAVYEVLVGPVDRALQIDHVCRNRACVNPYHLEPVTAAENARRAAPFKPRGTDNHNGVKTHCPQGHEYSPENTTIDKRNRRYCRICHRNSVRKCWQEKRRARLAVLDAIDPEQVAS